MCFHIDQIVGTNVLFDFHITPSEESQAQNNVTNSCSLLNIQIHLVPPNKYLKKTSLILTTWLRIHV